jgi:hypothetical protein
LPGELPPVVCLGFCGWDVAQALHQSMMVEPGHPVQRGDLHRLARLPRPAPVDQLGLVQTVDRLGRRVVVTVVAASHRGLDPRLGQRGPTCVPRGYDGGRSQPSSPNSHGLHASHAGSTQDSSRVCHALRRHQGLHGDDVAPGSASP